MVLKYTWCHTCSSMFGHKVFRGMEGARDRPPLSAPVRPLVLYGEEAKASPRRACRLEGRPEGEGGGGSRARASRSRVRDRHAEDGSAASGGVCQEQRARGSGKGFVCRWVGVLCFVAVVGEGGGGRGALFSRVCVWVCVSVCGGVFCESVGLLGGRVRQKTKQTTVTL